MKFTRIITSVLLASISMSVLCCGCSKTNETTRKPRNDYDETKVVKKLPEDEILIISGHQNEAWGHHSSMTYVLSDGSVYNSQEYFEGYGIDWDHSLTDEQRAALLKKYTLTVACIEEKQLLKIYNYIINIKPDAKFVYSDEYACDAGTSFTKVNVKGNWVMIEESGDMTGELNDRYARKADKLIGEVFASFSRDLKYPSHLYSCRETFIGTFECRKTVTKDTRRIITNMDELKAFEKDTGIDIRNNESFKYFGDTDYDSFNWCCIGIEVVVYPEYLSLDDVSADAFIVSDPYVGFAYLEDPRIDVSDDVVPQKCYCHVVQLPNENLEDYDWFLKGN